MAETPRWYDEDEREGDFDDEFEGGFRCVLGDDCLFPHPFHFPSECHGVEDMEAYHAEMEEDGG